jgi:hypothetical protein
MTSNNSFPAQRARVRAAIAIVLINAVLLTVLLIAMELLLRAFAVPSAVEYSVYAPNLRTTVTVDASITPGVRDSAIFEINALGTRGPLPKSDDDVRILTIGREHDRREHRARGADLEAELPRREICRRPVRQGRLRYPARRDQRPILPDDPGIVLQLAGRRGARCGREAHRRQPLRLPAPWRLVRVPPARRGVWRALENLALLSAREREVRRSLNQTLPDFDDRSDRGRRQVHPLFDPGCDPCHQCFRERPVACGVGMDMVQQQVGRVDVEPAATQGFTVIAQSMNLRG